MFYVVFVCCVFVWQCFIGVFCVLSVGVAACIKNCVCTVC